MMKHPFVEMYMRALDDLALSGQETSPTTPYTLPVIRFSITATQVSDTEELIKICSADRKRSNLSHIYAYPDYRRRRKDHLLS
jgi:hypothetical protein